MNTENLDRPGGELSQVDGTATVPDPTQPGKLTVYINTGLPFTFGAPCKYYDKRCIYPMLYLNTFC